MDYLSDTADNYMPELHYQPEMWSHCPPDHPNTYRRVQLLVR